VGGTWSQQAWIPFQWLARTHVNTNSWTNNIDYSKFYNLINGVQVARVSGSLLQVLDCGFSPIITMTTALACDCTSGADARDCFSQTITFPVGSADCFSTTGCSTSGVGVGALTVPPTSAPTGQSSVTVYSTPTVNFDQGSQAGQSARRNAFAVQSVGGSVSYGGQTVGQFIGNGLGYKFTGTPRGNVQVCLPVDPTISVSSAYTLYDFGVLCADGSVHALGATVTVNSLGVCGTVTATGNYYPVRRTTISGQDSSCTVVSAGQGAANPFGAGGPGGSSSGVATNVLEWATVAVAAVAVATNL